MKMEINERELKGFKYPSLNRNINKITVRINNKIIFSGHVVAGETTINPMDKEERKLYKKESVSATLMLNCVVCR